MKNQSKNVVACLVAAAGCVCALGPIAGAADWRFQHAYGTAAAEAVGAVISTRDGGSLVVGSRLRGGKQAIWVVRFDPGGTVMWERYVDTTAEDEVAHSVVETVDGGYVIAGDRTSTASGSQLEAVLFKLDQLGNLLWARAYFGLYNSVGPRHARVIEMPNGDLAVTGRQLRNLAPYMQYTTVARFSAAGGWLWGWGYRDNRTSAGSVVQGGVDITLADNSADPDMIVAGFTSAGTGAQRESHVMRINPVGLVSFSKVYNNAAATNLFANGLAIVGSEVLVTTRQAAGGGASQLLRLNAANLTHAGAPRSFTNLTVSNASIVVNGTNLWMTGTLAAASAQVALVRTSIAGLPSVAIQYGSTGIESARSLARASGECGGWLIAGLTNSVGAGADDLYLIRTNNAGQSGCFETTYTQGVTNPPPFAADIPIERFGLQWDVWTPTVTATDGTLTDLCTTCPCDFNGDTSVDFFDYLDFVAAFAVDDPSADFNCDGTIDFFDYLDFVACSC